jgi:hypothetical protein
LYRGQLKTDASRGAVPIPDDIIPIIEAWRMTCPDSSPEALLFPTFGRAERKGQKVPRRAKNFLKWRIYSIADKLKIPRKLVTFQVMRRTLGTDLQKHRTMKDAQGALRHARCVTPASRPQPTCTCRRFPRASRLPLTRGRVQFWRSSARISQNSGVQRVPTCPNSKKWRLQVPEKIGSSGRTRTYNPPVNSRMLCH